MYIIEVTDHTNGNVSVKVTDTNGTRLGNTGLVYHRHQFPARKIAFEYGEAILASYIRTNEARKARA